MQRTNKQMTAGICNIPLSLPATLFFNSSSPNETQAIENMFMSFKIGYVKAKTPNYEKMHIQSVSDVHSRLLRQVFRNYRSLKPKVFSSYRYVFWEIDTQDETIMQECLNVFAFLKLPVYVHKTMRGYHFLSVKPVEKSVWQFAIKQLRNTNPSYPPVTLRILANKYEGELEKYQEGKCIFINEAIHKDTLYLKDFIEKQDIVSLEHLYMIVFYPLPKQQDLDNMTFEQREEFQDAQIENSEVNRIV